MDRPALPRVTVVIPAYTLDRWQLLESAVESARHQSAPPLEVVVCIDGNPELLRRCVRRWAASTSGLPPVRVMSSSRSSADNRATGAHARAHGSRRRFGAGWARNSAVEVAEGEVIAFLDDDARADRDWLERLTAPYADPAVLAVGGAPLPHYETVRPEWFPPGFDWVFGCAYDGLPTSLSPLRHLIGANMSVRRSALRRIGGFHSIDFDDLDMCMRLDRLLPGSVWYEPSATVHHHVPAERVSWRYFYRRCYFVNREKVLAFREMGDAADLTAERAFVLRQLGRLVNGTAGDGTGGLRQRAAALVGISASGLGHLAGRLRYRDVPAAFGQSVPATLREPVATTVRNTVSAGESP